jgi:ribosome-binding protein aMBF1 (putative translation factor)
VAVSRKVVAGDEVLRRQLKDEVFRAEWQRGAFARAVALRVVTYRAEHGLSQRALGRKLGMAQSAVARLEAGEHTPTLETMQRLARVLGTGFVVHVDPKRGLQLLDRAG